MRIWNALLRRGGANGPPSDEDVAIRAAFERERRAQNLRAIGRIAPVAFLIHVTSIVAFTRSSSQTPEQEAWLHGLIRIHVILGVVALVVSAVSLRGWFPRLRERLGDLTGVVYLLGTSAISANSQRAHPNLSSITYGALAVALMISIDPRLFVGTLLAGGALVAFASAHFPHGQAIGTADAMSILVVVTVSTAAFFANRNLRLRELKARLQVERLNAELERRVESQVHEIVARAGEIDELNTQLNSKVRERSRELTMALARLAADHEDIPRGTVLGDRVQIEKPIGKGGMGAVYSARDLVTGKTVAVKVVQAGSANELDDLYRFLREAQALASLTHPAIVRSLHVDVADDGRLFQMMELVLGESLQSHLERQDRLSSFHAARLGAVLAEGLAAAHAAGIVHRDVKPANVMLTRASPGLKLLDFGISKLKDARQQGGGTQGSVIGTLEFLSPEQVNDPTQITDRADVYQLGLVLYLAISGRLPYNIDSARSWLLAHTLQPPEDLLSIASDTDPEVARVIMGCLTKVPSDRPSASAVAASLGALAGAAGTPPLENLGLCAPAESGAGPALSNDDADGPSTGVRGASQPWRRTLKARR